MTQPPRAVFDCTVFAQALINHDDAHYVNLSDAVKAAFLVSRDKDLCDLMNSANFKKRFPELHIVAPPQFLRHISHA